MSFTVTFDQFNASLMNKSINFLIIKEMNCVCVCINKIINFLIFFLYWFQNLNSMYVCVCVCVCVWKRESVYLLNYILGTDLYPQVTKTSFRGVLVCKSAIKTKLLKFY